MQVGFGMKMSRRGRWLANALLGALLAANVWAAPEKEAPGQTVDSGSFGVFINGKRVATETFSIHQSDTGSSIISRFKTESGSDPAEQSSELQLTAGGELRSYEWKEIGPGQSQATVLPSQDFLTERFTSSPTDKPQEQPFLLPASTSVLDDYFFIQREVLAWKYLATSCKQEKGGVSCPLKEKAQLGTLNAHARASALVNLQFSGRERLSLHGAEQELIRLDLKSEAGDWVLWLDDQLKLQRIADSANTTEVVRD
ncbi:MAG: hypothetical protein ACLP6G_00720 [Terriglobales bacterium]